MDKATKEEPRPADIGDVLHNDNGGMIFMFSKNMGVIESKEAEVLTILEATCIFSSSFQGMLIVDIDSSNAITWLKSVDS